MAVDASRHDDAAYTQVCASYHAIDDFRMKLLGLLPVATGTGVFLLLDSDNAARLEDFHVAIGLIGFAFTLGLFAFELYGIKRCHYLISTGKRLEVSLGVDGQFRNRPQELMGFIYEPLASGFIYSASMAAWLFLLVAYEPEPLPWLVPSLVFAAGLAVTIGAAKGIDRADRRRFRETVLQEVAQRPTVTVALLSESVKAETKAVQHALRDCSAIDVDAPVVTARVAAVKEPRRWLVVKDGEPVATVGADDLAGVDDSMAVGDFVAVVGRRYQS